MWLHVRNASHRTMRRVHARVWKTQDEIAFFFFLHKSTSLQKLNCKHLVNLSVCVWQGCGGKKKEKKKAELVIPL